MVFNPRPSLISYPFDNIAFGLQKEKTSQRKRFNAGFAGNWNGLDWVPTLHSQGKAGRTLRSMQKRVALADLAMEPDIILYDEPTNGLDPIMAGVITELILQVQRSLGVTSLLVTHDLRTALRVGDEIGLLYQGKIRELGPPQAIMGSKNPLLRQFIEGAPTGPLSINGEW